MAYTYAAGTPGVITQANTDSQSITAVVDAGGGELDFTVASSAAYSTGDMVEVTGTTSYNSVFIVFDVPNATTITVLDVDIRGISFPFVATETGTIELGDVAPSGLNGLTGVTTITNSVSDHYEIDASTRMEINGAARIDPNNVSVRMIRQGSAKSDTVTCYVNGTLELGKRTVSSGGVEVYSSGLALDFPEDNTGSSASEFVFGVDENGTLIGNGGTIRTSNSIFYRNGAAQRINDLTFQAYDDGADNQYRLDTTGTAGDAVIDILGLTLEGLEIGNPIRFFTSYGFNNAVLTLKNARIQTANGSEPDQTYANLANANNANSDDTYYISSDANVTGVLIIQNAEVAVRPTKQTSASGYSQIYRQTEVTPQDTAGSGIEYSYYGQGFDSGNRRLPPSGLIGSVDDTATKVYTAVNQTGPASINYLIMVHSSILADGSGNPVVEDDRTSSGTIPTKYYGHGYEPATFEDNLYGLFTLEKNLPNLPNFSVTETSRAAVNAYPITVSLVGTTFTFTGDGATLRTMTAAQMYDLVSVYMQENYDTLLGADIRLGRSGVTIDATGYDIVLSYITYTGGMTVGGTEDITLQNGSTIGGGTFTGDVLFADSGLTFTAAPATKLVHTAGPGATTLTLDASDVTEVEVTGEADLVITLTNGSALPILTQTSGTITLVNPMTITFTGLTAGDTIYVEDNLDVQQVLATAVGATYQFNIARENQGETWDFAVDRVGYTPSTGSIIVAEGTTQTIPIGLTEYLTATGEVMYQGTTSPDVTIVFDLVTPQATINIGNMSVSPQVIFDEFEQALVASADGMAWHARFANVVTHDDLPGVGPILFLQDNIRLRRELAGDVNAAVGGYVLSTQGTVVDGTNGGVGFVGGLDADALAVAVWAQLTSASTVLNSMGKLIVDNLDVAISTRATAANVLNEEIESGYSLKESVRLQNAILLGKASGAPNGTVFRDIADTKNRVTSTTDNDGNRTNVTLDET